MANLNPFSSNSSPIAPLELDYPKHQVLTALRQQGSLSRTAISELIGYSPSKITGVVNELIADGIVEEKEDSQYTGGRRAKNLYFNPNFAYIVAIVVGIEKLDMALVDASETIRVRRMLPISREDSPSQILQEMSQFILERLEKLAIPLEKVLAVGFTLPTAIDPRSHTSTESEFFSAWTGYQIDSFLRELFPYAVVHIDREANAMAFAELRRGAGKAVTNFLYLNVAFPLSLSLVLDGHVYAGANGRAGTNTAIPSTLGSGKYAKPSDLGAASQDGDSQAQSLILENAERIGEALASFINFIDPELILIGGEAQALGHSFLAMLRRSVLDLAQASTTQNLQVALAPLGTEASMMGVVLLSAERMFRLEK